MTRLEALCIAFGWRGGTIHQAAQECGLSASQLLDYAKPKNRDIDSAYSMGWFAARTCPREFNLRVNFPRRIGSAEYFSGVADGIIEEYAGK